MLRQGATSATRWAEEAFASSFQYTLRTAHAAAAEVRPDCGCQRSHWHPRPLVPPRPPDPCSGDKAPLALRAQRTHRGLATEDRGTARGGPKGGAWCQGHGLLRVVYAAVVCQCCMLSACCLLHSESGPNPRAGAGWRLYRGDPAAASASAGPCLGHPGRHAPLSEAPAPRAGGPGRACH